jgi:hypothetical protein
LQTTTARRIASSPCFRNDEKDHSIPAGHISGQSPGRVRPLVINVRSRTYGCRLPPMDTNSGAVPG